MRLLVFGVTFVLSFFLFMEVQSWFQLVKEYSAAVADTNVNIKVNNNATINNHKGSTDHHPKTRRKPTVAVCITGIPERLQPEHLITGLIFPNLDKFDFHLIYALGEHKELIYSTNPNQKFDPSPYATYNTTESLTQKIQNLLVVPPDIVKVRVLPFITDLTEEQWKKNLSLPLEQPLTAIQQYAGITDKILNMYNHQVECAQAIEQMENDDDATLQQEKFDYIISTREDAYWFQPLNLTKLIIQGMMILDDDDNNSNNNNGNDNGGCDIVTKDCLAWNGLNMRFQLLPRHRLTFLSDRLKHYASLYYANGTVRDSVFNPEQLELHQARQYHNMTSLCTRSVDEIPVTVARHTYNGSFCFQWFEIEQGCSPTASRDFVNNRLCRNIDVVGK